MKRFRVSRDKIVRIAQTFIVEAETEQEAINIAADPDRQVEPITEVEGEPLCYENDWAEEVSAE